MLNLDNVEKKIAFNQKRPDDKWIMWIGIRLMIVLFCKEYFGTINMNTLLFRYFYQSKYYLYCLILNQIRNCILSQKRWVFVCNI